MSRKTLEAIVVAAALVAVFLVSSGVLADDLGDSRPDFIGPEADVALSAGLILVNHITIGLNIASVAYHRKGVTNRRSNRGGVGGASVVFGTLLLSGAVLSAVDLGGVDELFDFVDAEAVPLVFDIMFAIHGAATIAAGINDLAAVYGSDSGKRRRWRASVSPTMLVGADGVRRVGLGVVGSF